jgi:hypothetical protein
MGPTPELAAGQCANTTRTADNLRVVRDVEVCQ